MLSRYSPAFLAVAGTVVVVGGLVGALYWIAGSGRPGLTAEPLIVYCAEAMRLPMDAIAKDYEAEYGQKVELRYNPSQTILTSLELTQKGDLFLPADDSYIDLAREKGLVKPGDVLSLARMHAVVVVSPNCKKSIKSWDDFVASGHQIGLANVKAAAISKLLERELKAQGKWDALAKRGPNFLGNVNEVFNSVHNVHSNDVGIVWDVTANPHPGVSVVKLKELEKVKAHVKIALTSFCSQRDHALNFVCYIRARDKGARYYKEQGFSDFEERGVMSPKAELVVHAGAMLQPALKPALIEFEKRENVKVSTVYNGCGILVAGMETGAVPDVYFACDTSFMDKVNNKFTDRVNVSNNQLVIAVRRDNPKTKEVKELIDLATPGLKIGIGHEHNCALGSLTAETFRFAGVYGKVMKNIEVTSPTGDALVNQLRAKSLDVVVCYRSNVKEFLNELDTVEIKGIKCATPAQPIAIGKNSAHPAISRRLLDYLRTPESRARFESLGFGWEAKEVEAPRK